MPQRTADAEWNGDLESGDGHVQTESGVLDDPYDVTSRFEHGPTTNPEELLGAAHAACYSMALSNILDEAGHDPESIDTQATVTLEMDEGPRITAVHLDTAGRVPGIDAATFEKYAGKAKRECPVSGALDALEVTLDVTLEG
jgi:osmotically inducible protein OsmC